MRARHDLGFGHPTGSAGITGVAELKAGPGTLDRLDAISRRDEESTELQAVTQETRRLDEPLLLDFRKMLDPQLPEDACRISRIVSVRRGRSTAEEIRVRAASIVERVAGLRKLTGTTFRIDPRSACPVFEFPQHQIQVQLAW
jgi:hypothetical protein